VGGRTTLPLPYHPATMSEANHHPITSLVTYTGTVSMTALLRIVIPLGW
jgi:hypothetical protein